MAAAHDPPRDRPRDHSLDHSQDYQQRRYAYRRSAEQDASAPVRHPVIVVGAGPVGLTLAIELALQQVPVLLLDNDDRLSTGSRAICFAKRTLEIFDRLGCGQTMVDKGVSWNVGKVFFRDAPLYAFNLSPEPGHGRPAFINLQQYYVEGYLADRAAELRLITLRWRHSVSGIVADESGVRLSVDTPDGPCSLLADHVVACDGARSTLRKSLGLQAHGRSFKDRFLIADVKMRAPFPTERWFWFDPPFHPGQSVLLHKQPDDVWRIDFQLGWDADPQAEQQPERIIPRVQALLGPGVDFSLEWASVYSFSCLRMDSFVHGRVLFAGDAAHGVSPFGARGANSGVQDADNLGWKLAAVVQGRAGPALLASYGTEREAAADENILNSTRATDFITPKSEVSRLFRDATLDLARQHPFARSLVNSGRLSLPAVLADSPLSTADVDSFAGSLRLGGVAPDAPVQHCGQAGWLLQFSRSGAFTALCFGPAPPWLAEIAVADLPAPLRLLCLAAADQAPAADPADPTEAAEHLSDSQGLASQRYDALPGTLVLLRPDQHVCARWRRPEPQALRAAMRRALAQP